MAFSMPISKWENRLSTGRVQACDGNAVLVCGEAGMVRAEKAASCFLMPQKGDAVLLALLTSGEAWVLAVLERGENEAVLNLPEKTKINGKGVELRSDSLAVQSQKTEFVGKTLTMDEDSMQMKAGLLDMSGKVLLKSFSVAQSMARWLSETIVRKKERYGRLERKVDGLAKCKAGRVREEIEAEYRLRSGTLDAKAETRMDLDAESIRIG